LRPFVAYDKLKVTPKVTSILLVEKQRCWSINHLQTIENLPFKASSMQLQKTKGDDERLPCGAIYEMLTIIVSNFGGVEFAVVPIANRVGAQKVVLVHPGGPTGRKVEQGQGISFHRNEFDRCAYR
jgi:hypothetical protein